MLNMENKVRKISRTLIVLVLLLMTTACTQLQCDMNIYPNGEYSYSIDVYVPEEFTELSTINEKSIIAITKNVFNLSDEKISEISKNVDGVNYKGLNIVHERSLPKVDSQMTIEVDDWENILNFNLVYDKHDIWFDLNPLGTEEEFYSFIEMNGYELKLVFHMPGEVLSSNTGVIEGNDVIINLMSDDFNEINIVSKVPFLSSTEMMILVAVIIVIALISYLFYRHKQKPKNKNSQTKEIVIDENLELDDNQEQVEENEVETVKETKETIVNSEAEEVVGTPEVLATTNEAVQNKTSNEEKAIVKEKTKKAKKKFNNVKVIKETEKFILIDDDDEYKIEEEQ